MKKILIISAYFYPEITPRSFRTTELVKELAKRGYDITLYIPYREYNYSSFCEEYNLTIKFLPKSNLEVNLPKGSAVYKRAIRMFYYKFLKFTEYPYIKFLSSIPKYVSENKNFDVLISIAAPHAIHWGCEKLLSKKKISVKKWIADCGDPFMGDQTSKKPLYFNILEKKFCNKADYITLPISDAINGYKPQYKNKIRIIPQGFEFDGINYTKTQEHPIPTFAFAGSFYSKYRDPSPFFDYLLTVDKSYKLILYIENNSLLSFYKNKFGDKLEIRKRISRNELLKELSQMDFLINFENKGEVQLPSKLIDYTITNRPILSIPFSNFDENNILNFLNGNYENQYVIPNINEYNIKTVVNKFIELF